VFDPTDSSFDSFVASHRQSLLTRHLTDSTLPTSDGYVDPYEAELEAEIEKTLNFLDLSVPKVFHQVGVTLGSALFTSIMTILGFTIHQSLRD
jgi:hypothetical protein